MKEANLGVEAHCDVHPQRWFGIMIPLKTGTASSVGTRRDNNTVLMERDVTTPGFKQQETTENVLRRGRTLISNVNFLA